jgi:KipI family sensor histidine kinase inhibitor
VPAAVPIVRFLPAGDLALSVELGDEISVAVNTRVRALEYLIQQKGVPGVVETVPSFRSLLLYYDPLLTSYPALCEALATLAAQTETATLPPPRHVEIPCCYDDPELGFELAGAAARLGLSPDEVVRQHSGAEYLVYFIGFTPGLPYMDLPARLTIARLETPRTKTPPGSVSIGGAQCCIYPSDSPGGFWVIGRTPLRLYDPDAGEPTLLRAGDRVRFRPIERGEFDRIAAAVAARSYTVAVS